MIYTNYFAKLKDLPKKIVPIAICGGIPDWYNGLCYKKLAPSWNIFSEWKNSNKDKDAQNKYIERYENDVLNKLKASEVVDELNELLIKNNYDTDEYSIALICYEKYGDFCHRHLVSNWIRNNGWHDLCFEYNFDNIIPDCVYRYIKSVIGWENSHVGNDFAYYGMDSYRTECHEDMIDYYNIDYRNIEALSSTKSYDMSDYAKMHKDKVYGVQYGEKYMKDKEVIARDLHSILNHYKFISDKWNELGYEPRGLG